MNSIRLTAPIAVLLPALALVGCGADDEPDDDTTLTAPTGSPSEDAAEESSRATSSPPTTGQAGALPAACDVITAADVEAAFGVAVRGPDIGGGGTSEGNLTWSSDDCGFEAEDVVEVDLKLTGPDDFSQGSFTCPKPSGFGSRVTAVEMPGVDAAWWEVDDGNEATLRVCTAEFNFDVEVEYDDDGPGPQGDPQQQAVTLAEQVLATLQG